MSISKEPLKSIYEKTCLLRLAGVSFGCSEGVLGVGHQTVVIFSSETADASSSLHFIHRKLLSLTLLFRLSLCWWKIYRLLNQKNYVNMNSTSQPKNSTFSSGNLQKHNKISLLLLFWQCNVFKYKTPQMVYKGIKVCVRGHFVYLS